MTSSSKDWELDFNNKFCFDDFNGHSYDKSLYTNRNQTEDIKSFIRTLLAEREKEVVGEMIDLSDDIEIRGNTTLEEWKAFKGFRNAMRDRLALSAKENIKSIK